MPFDLKLIESFVAVAETLSFSGAAERQNTVQSAISAHIKRLEERVGRPLIERGRGQAVTLTSEGLAFLAQARRLLAFADEMLGHPAGGPNVDPMRLGTTLTFALSVVPRALAALDTSHESPSIRVKTARSHELMGLLDDGEIDCALVIDQGPRPDRIATSEIDLCWVTADTFVWPPGQPLPMIFMEDARDLRRHAFAALDAADAIEASLSTHPDPVGMRAVLYAGLGVTAIPKIGIVHPLKNVEAALNLPPLGSLSVSLYCALRPGKITANNILEALVLELRRETE